MRDFYGRVPERINRTGINEESALLIVLMLLLKSEGSDRLLIFALLYILT